MYRNVSSTKSSRYLKRGGKKRKKDRKKSGHKYHKFKTFRKVAKKSLGKALLIEFLDAYVECFANNLKRREKRCLLKQSRKCIKRE